MSFLSLFNSQKSSLLIDRRQALVGLSVLTLAACSRSAPMAGAPPAAAQEYTCPMHPFVRSVKPNDHCPICGMDLVPVKGSAAPESTNAAPAPAAGATGGTASPAAPSHDHSRMASSAAPMSDAGTIQIAPERLKELGVRLSRIERRALNRSLRAPARVEVDESTLRDINVKAGAGFITRLYANSRGMSFRRGEPLMTVLCEGWLQTQIDYLRAYRAWKRSPALQPNNSFALDQKLELMRARIRIWDLSSGQIARLEKFALSTDETDLRTGHGLSGSFDVLAPFDGYVHVKTAVEGMRFEPGQSLLQIADHQRVWVVAEFPESQAPFADIGQKVTVSFPSLPGLRVKTTIDFIDPHVDDMQRRVRVRAVVNDMDRRLHPGLFAEIEGSVGAGSGLLVPAAAVVPTGNKFIVFVDRGGGQLEPRQIETGTRWGDDYEVISGLREGDRVVASAAFLIDAESRIQGVLKTWGDKP